jgi:hypothetical protein
LFGLARSIVALSLPCNGFSPNTAVNPTSTALPCPQSGAMWTGSDSQARRIAANIAKLLELLPIHVDR